MTLQRKPMKSTKKLEKSTEGHRSRIVRNRLNLFSIQCGKCNRTSLLYPNEKKRCRDCHNPINNKLLKTIHKLNSIEAQIRYPDYPRYWKVFKE